MKKIVSVLSLAMVAMVFAACNTHQAELDAAIKTNDSLSLIIQNKDTELDSLFATLNQIEENLAAVNSRYNTVQELRRANMEGQPNVKSQISAQIKDIENLMAANRQKIAHQKEQEAEWFKTTLLVVCALSAILILLF